MRQKIDLKTREVSAAKIREARERLLEGVMIDIGDDLDVMVENASNRFNTILENQPKAKYNVITLSQEKKDKLSGEVFVDLLAESFYQVADIDPVIKEMSEEAIKETAVTFFNEFIKGDINNVSKVSDSYIINSIAQTIKEEVDDLDEEVDGETAKKVKKKVSEREKSNINTVNGTIVSKVKKTLEVERKIADANDQMIEELKENHADVRSIRQHEDSLYRTIFKSCIKDKAINESVDLGSASEMKIIIAETNLQYTLIEMAHTIKFVTLDTPKVKEIMKLYR